MEDKVIYTGRYIMNSSSCISIIDSNALVLKSLSKRFNLRGDNISNAIYELLDCFKRATSIEDAVLKISPKYSAASMDKMCDFLVENKILISEDEFIEMKTYDESFIEKALYYTLNGKSLNQVVKELGKIKIGIIGTNQMVNCLLNDLSNTDMLINFHTCIVDKENKLVQPHQKNSINLEQYTDFSDRATIATLVDNCDLIIACSNYCDHYMFKIVNELCIEKSKRWLRVVIEGKTSEIGPLFIPNETCCYSCMRSREKFNMPEVNLVFDKLYEESDLHQNIKTVNMGLCSMFHLNTLSSAMASIEVMKLLTGSNTNLLNRVIRVNSADFDIKTEIIFKDYLCPVCSDRR